MIHRPDTVHMAYNLPDMVDNRPDNTDQLDTDRLHQNTELHPPDNGKHHRNPSRYNYEALEPAEGEPLVVKQEAGVSADSIGTD